MSTIVSDLVGAPPSPAKASYRAWVYDVLAAMQGICPLARTTTYYFSQSGNDSTGDGSEATPWQTLAKAQTEHDAWTESSGGLALLFNRGDTWEEATGLTITKSYVTVAAYGTGKKPYFNWFQSKIASGGGTWVQSGATDRWDATVSGLGWVREEDRPLLAYRQVANTTECENTPLSWYHTGTTLSINAGDSIDPNSYDYEYTPSTTDDESGITIDAGADQVRIDGLRFDGWGLYGSLEQNYGIKSGATGTDRHLVSNCECYYNSRHNYGANSTSVGSGGLTVWHKCKAGYTQEQSGSMFIAYAGLGGQEAFVIQNTIPYGALPDDDTREDAAGVGMYSHCEGSNEVGYLCYMENEAYGNSAWSCDQISLVAAVSTPSAADLASVKVVRYGDVQRLGGKGVGHGTKWLADQACINGHYELRPQDVGQQALALQDTGGWVINCYIEMDLVDVTQAFFAFWHTNTASAPKLWHNHLHIKQVNGTRCAIDRENLNNAQAAKLAGTELVNSIFTASGNSAGDRCDPALLNTASGIRDSCFYGMTNNAAEGYTNATDAFVVAEVPDKDIPPAYGSELAAGEANLVEYDKHNRPRNLSTPTIGPLEVAAETQPLELGSSTNVSAFVAAAGRGSWPARLRRRAATGGAAGKTGVVE